MKSALKGQSAHRLVVRDTRGGASSDFQGALGLSFHSKSGVQTSLPHTFTPVQQRALEVPQEAPPPHLGCRPGSRLCHPQAPPPFVSVVAASLPDRGSPRVTEAAPAGPWTRAGHTHHAPLAGQRDEHVTALMHQELAVDAAVALPRETPYPLTALATVRSLQAGTAAVRAGVAPEARDPAQHRAPWCCP